MATDGQGGWRNTILAGLANYIDAGSIVAGSAALAMWKADYGLRFTPSSFFTTYATWRHIGKRAANRYVAFNLPSYNEVDLGATLSFGERATLGFNVNNVFNSHGVLSWAPGGALTAALDRQALTPASVAANPGQLFSVIENQPRSFFVTAGLKF